MNPEHMDATSAEVRSRDSENRTDSQQTGWGKRSLSKKQNKLFQPTALQGLRNQKLQH